MNEMEQLRAEADSLKNAIRVSMILILLLVVVLRFPDFCCAPLQKKHYFFKLTNFARTKGRTKGSVRYDPRSSCRINGTNR